MKYKIVRGTPFLLVFSFFRAWKWEQVRMSVVAVKQKLSRNYFLNALFPTCYLLVHFHLKFCLVEFSKARSQLYVLSECFRLDLWIHSRSDSRVKPTDFCWRLLLFCFGTSEKTWICDVDVHWKNRCFVI